MTAARLLERFDRVAEAPGAVAKLRRFILDLAVRGKLVPHDAPERSATESAGKSTSHQNRAAPEEAIDSSDLGFELPPGWVAYPLGTIAECLDGQRIPVNAEERREPQVSP